MCRRAECSSCGRPTFAGCGAHVEQVLGDVPASKRCKCREEKSGDANRSTGKSDATENPSWFRSLFTK